MAVSLIVKMSFSSLFNLQRSLGCGNAAFHGQTAWLLMHNDALSLIAPAALP